MKLEKIANGFVSFMAEWTANVESSLKGVGSYEAERILRARDGKNWTRHDQMSRYGLRSEFNELADGADVGLALVASPLFLARAVYRVTRKIYTMCKG